MATAEKSGKLSAPKISRDLVKDAVFTKVERHLEMPVILQTLENKGFNDRLANTLGAVFDHQLGAMKHRLDKKYTKAASKVDSPGRRNAWKERSEEIETGNVVRELSEQEIKDEYLADLRENADIFKRNFKKIAKMIVSDMWKTKNQEVLDQYGDPNANSFQYGSYFYDDYTGPYYYVQEQRRLKKIVQGRVEESILKSRSDAYSSRYQATDALRISQELNPNTSLAGSTMRSSLGASYFRPKPQNIYRNKMSQLLDSKLHQDEELLKRSIAGKLGTPGPGAYDIEAHEKSKGYSFAPKPDNDLSIRIGFDPLHKQSMHK